MVLTRNVVTARGVWIVDECGVDKFMVAAGALLQSEDLNTFFVFKGGLKMESQVSTT